MDIIIIFILFVLVIASVYIALGLVNNPKLTIKIPRYQSNLKEMLDMANQFAITKISDKEIEKSIQADKKEHYERILKNLEYDSIKDTIKLKEPAIEQ